MSDREEMTLSEILVVCQEWQQHFDLLEGKVDAEHLAHARGCFQPDYFKDEPFHFRPVRGEDLRFQMYSLLTCAPPGGDEDAMLICRLTTGELQVVYNIDDPFWEPDENDYAARFLKAKIDLEELVAGFR